MHKAYVGLYGVESFDFCSKLYTTIKFFVLTWFLYHIYN